MESSRQRKPCVSAAINLNIFLIISFYRFKQQHTFLVQRSPEYQDDWLIDQNSSICLYPPTRVIFESFPFVFGVLTSVAISSKSFFSFRLVNSKLLIPELNTRNLKNIPSISIFCSSMQ